MVLDETLTLLTEIVQPEHGCGTLATRPCRVAVMHYLDSMRALDLRIPDADELPRADLDVLRAHGVPLRSEADIERAYDDLADRRRSLAAMLHHDASDPHDLHV